MPETKAALTRITWVCSLQLFIGFGFPYEGPAPLEAIANGCVFLQARFNPPHSSLNHEFFRGKPTSREASVGEKKVLNWDFFLERFPPNPQVQKYPGCLDGRGPAGGCKGECGVGDACRPQNPEPIAFWLGQIHAHLSWTGSGAPLQPEPSDSPLVLQNEKDAGTSAWLQGDKIPPGLACRWEFNLSEAGTL